MRKINLFELGEEMNCFLELCELDQGEFTREHEKLREELEETLTRKTDSAVEFVHALEDRKESIEKRITELKASAGSIDNYITRTKAYFQAFLDQTKCEQIYGELYQIKKMKARKVVVVEDETKLPLQYVKMIYSPMKREIKEALESGLKVEGAIIVDGKQGLKLGVRPVKKGRK